MATATLHRPRPKRQRVIPLGPPHALGFLLDHRVDDHFIWECVHTRLPAAEKLRLSSLYAERWGSAELMRVLRKAAQLAPLDEAMGRLLRDLTCAEVAA